MALKAPCQRREAEHRPLQREHSPLERKQHIDHEHQRTSSCKAPDRHRPSQRRHGSAAFVAAVTSASDQQHHNFTTCAAATTEQNDEIGGDDDDEMLCSALKRVTVVVLGARGVGKTSLVRQFVYGDSGCADETIISKTRHSTVDAQRKGYKTRRGGRLETDNAAMTPGYHHVAVVVDRHLYDVRVVDCPPISRFPTSAVQEWTDFRGYGLRHATAYVIVYDVTDEESFAYVRSMREQIVRYRAAQLFGNGSSGTGGGSKTNTATNGSPTSPNDVPIIVAANKVDLIAGGNGGGGGSGVASYVGNMVNGSGLGERIALTAAAVTGRQQRDVGNVIRKQWKCAYVECSARFNWRVVSLFRDLMKAVDLAARHQQQQQLHHHNSHLQSAAGSLVRVHDALHNNHCCIL